MTRVIIIGLSIAALFCGVAFNSNAPAQSTLKQQITGAWTLVAVNQTDKEGKLIMLFGKNPKGSQIFDATGLWMQIIWDSDVPKYKVDSRIGGTPEENTTAVRGTTATFGTWSVDEGSKTLTVRYTGSLFPNQAGTESKRAVSVTGDELKIINPVTAGGVRSDTIWRRAK